MSEPDHCERCGGDANGTPRRAMCGHPLQPITDEEIAGIRGTYDCGGVAALGFSQVARLLDKIDSLREEARALGLERAALRGMLDRVSREREQLLATTERQRAELAAATARAETAEAELAKLRAQQSAPRTEYGIRYPEHDHTTPTTNERTARAWAAHYTAIVDAGGTPRIRRRTVTHSATPWEDVDEEASG